MKIIILMKNNNCVKMFVIIKEKEREREGSINWNVKRIQKWKEIWKNKKLNEKWDYRGKFWERLWLELISC